MRSSTPDTAQNAFSYRFGPFNVIHLPEEYIAQPNKPPTNLITILASPHL
ncbi:hypothetical protein [Marinomonas sp. TW1]|nr:hypothetical protein [Marinomonas sp. TW1]